LVAAWIRLVVILVDTPENYDQSLKLPPGGSQVGEIAFFAALSLFIAVLTMGVTQRLRWTFWLILDAFLAGVLRVAAGILELGGLTHG
jgi:hypothetical protein